MTPHNALSLILFLAGLAVACGVPDESRGQQKPTRSAAASDDWRSVVKSELPLFGHRNWIVVADSAYPKQSAAGIRTVATGAGQLEVLETVLQEIAAAPHVQPRVLIDQELGSVPEKDAPGIEAYRKQLQPLLQDKQVSVMPHEEIIGKLDEAARLFNILILKTDMTLPYTSVFIELDCGYWNADKEQALRNALRSGQAGQ
jgi:hypothetical protein